MKDTHGNQTKKITELVDLYPTLAELAGLAPPSVLQGQSLVTLLDEPASRSWKKDMAFTISRSGGESIRTHDWRYIHWGYGEKGQELYDLKKDPGEFTNLAEDPNYSASMEKLKKQLLSKRIEAGYSVERFGKKKK
jgi:arylsulfatase A-like enzyme